jgi:hypothetical protein
MTNDLVRRVMAGTEQGPTSAVDASTAHVAGVRSRRQLIGART